MVQWRVEIDSSISLPPYLPLAVLSTTLEILMECMTFAPDCTQSYESTHVYSL